MRIFDGRSKFFQWDVDVKITSDTFKVGDEVHFYNGTTEKALVLIAYSHEGKVVADVPNILLTACIPMKVYRYVDTHTIEEYCFEVEMRPKPEGYVYTETECVTVKEFVDKAFQEAKDKFAPLEDGKVPAENLPSYMDDVVEGAMETSFGNFYPSGEHNEKVDEHGNVIPRKGVLYVDVSGAHIGKVFRWSGTSFVQVASTNLPDASEWNKGQFLMSDGSAYIFEEVRQLPRIGEASDSGKVLIVDDATRKAAWVTPPWVEKSYVDGLIGGVEEELHMINEGGVE